jgi:hypothetical protein
MRRFRPIVERWEENRIIEKTGEEGHFKIAEGGACHW